jgi:hypothetical protein
VIGILWPEALVVEEAKPAPLSVDVRIDLVDEVLVPQHAADLGSATRNEGHGRQPVARSQDRLRNLRLCRRVMRRDDPGRIGPLSHRSTPDPGHRLALPVDLRPCPTHATPHVTSTHDVGHMQRRSQPGAVAGEVRVFVRTRQLEATDRRDPDTHRAIGSRHAGDACGAKAARPIGREDMLA